MTNNSLQKHIIEPNNGLYNTTQRPTIENKTKRNIETNDSLKSKFTTLRQTQATNNKKEIFTCFLFTVIIPECNNIVWKNHH